MNLYNQIELKKNATYIPPENRISNVKLSVRYIAHGIRLLEMNSGSCTAANTVYSTCMYVYHIIHIQQLLPSIDRSARLEARLALSRVIGSLDIKIRLPFRAGEKENTFGTEVLLLSDDLGL